MKIDIDVYFSKEEQEELMILMQRDGCTEREAVLRMVRAHLIDIELMDDPSKDGRVEGVA